MPQEPTFRIENVPVYGDLVLAPLSGYSDQPFRSICRAMGSAISYTEFVSAHGVLRQNDRTLEILSFLPEERPITFQVFGHELQPLACDYKIWVQISSTSIWGVHRPGLRARVADLGS